MADELSPLALPDPQTVTLARVREQVPLQAAALREHIRARGSIAEAQELARRLEALRHYLLDHEGRDLLSREARRTEILIGQLLGPTTAGQRSDLAPSQQWEGAKLHHSRRHEFRRLAEHEALVERWMAEGFVSRPELLLKLKRWEENGARVGDGGTGELEVRAGDFRRVLADVPDGSATLVLTDPPYAQVALPLYDALGAFAARVLRPGGSLICYTGQFTVFEAHERLRAHLRYWWVLSVLHHHGGQRFPGRWVMCGYKPVLWFVNGGQPLGREYVHDVLRGSPPEKAHHEWAQGVEEVLPVIEQLTEPGELVVDPFAGSGSFGRAALALGRRFVGADLDPDGSRGTVAEAAG